jgi:hypothetical protein
VFSSRGVLAKSLLSTRFGERAVFHCHFFFAVIGKLAYLALLGFVVMMLVGPMLAVVSVLASFALIGMIFWLPLRLLGCGRPVEWGRVRNASQRYWGTVRTGYHRVHGVFQQHPIYLERAREAGRFMGRVFRETVCGTLVGGMLGLLAALQTSFHPRPLVLGLGVGFIVGALVALSSRSPVREAA